MFEKKLEECTSKFMSSHADGNNQNPHAEYFNDGLELGYRNGFKDGADIGYNKASDEAFYLGADFANKPHRWHFDEVPDNESDILCQIAKDEFVVGYYHTKNKRYYTTDGQEIDVIAWKEIIPPKEES